MRCIRRTIVLGLVALVPAAAAAQQTKRPMEHDVYDEWRNIDGEQLSPDGQWVAYSLTVADGDAVLEVRSVSSDQLFAIPRGVSPLFSADSRIVAFTIKPADSLVKQARLDKTSPDDMPKDSLGYIDLATGNMTTVPRVKSFAMPEDAGRWIAYHLEKAPMAPDSADTPAPASEAGPHRAGPGDDEEDEPKQSGTDLVVRGFETGSSRVYSFVSSFTFAPTGERLAYAASTPGGEADGVFVIELESGAAHLALGGEGVYTGLIFDESGAQLAFLSDRDDHDADQPAHALYHWRRGTDLANGVAEEGSAGVPGGWWVSEHEDLSFSDNGERLFFATAPRPEPKPDEVPEWERVELDVWNWQDPLLQPMQLVQLDDEVQRDYLAVVHLDDERIVQLADVELPEVRVGQEGDADVALGVSEMPYRQEISWASPRYNDFYVVDVATGDRRLLREALQANAELSPDGGYVTWWDRDDLAWFAQPVGGGEPRNLTDGVAVRFDNELHDWPYKPNPYGSAGWIEGDAGFLAYGKHDIWLLDPTGARPARNLTEGVGRRDNLRFRYAQLDRDELAISADEPLLLSAFDYQTKAAGHYRVSVEGSGEPQRLVMEDRRFGNPIKAADADAVMFTRQSFEEFPDIWVADGSLGDAKKISDANPQQSEYRWGNAELVTWRSTDGLPLEGLLFTPENFDPNEQYPMMVYFYEKNSQNLHAYRAPVAGGSSISVSFYVSRGYVVFIPDIHYRVGYPGESALDCVVPGVLSVLAKGFVDPERVGVQGHSWGGYQISYLVTQTNVFKAAEAGAPVSNMTSAYGGIRWGTGMSRMFQYEQTQSRLGGTLWNARQRYIENSPLFWTDKIETPVLMMHNDEDTAVPWYQGIEFFVALRRLGKPAWLLNYNGEPHGLRKHQNRVDWQIRMQQFFDHYLVDAPPPVWMVDGIPATRKGRDLGLELVTEPVSTTMRSR